MLFSSKKDLIGIDVGSSSVKIVRLKESRGNYQLANVGVLPLAPETIVDNTIMDSSAIVEAISNLIDTRSRTDKVREERAEIRAH